MYSNIINPETGRKVSSSGQIGRKVIKKYLQASYGSKCKDFKKGNKNYKGPKCDDQLGCQWNKNSKTKGVCAEFLVWIGDIGDIRETKDGQLIGWATVDGTYTGDFLDFKENAYQVRPRT